MHPAGRGADVAGGIRTGDLGVGVRTVAKWHAHPDAELRPDTSAMLDTVLDQLGQSARQRFSLLLADTPAPPDTTADRPDWLLDAATQSSMDALSRTSQVGAEVLPDLIQHVMQIARGYDSESRTTAFKHAQAMRELASRLADTTRRPSELADIYLALGQLNALMASLAFDLASWDAAAQLARAATRYADLSGHASLHAWTLGLEATLAFWSGDGRYALDRVNTALALAPARRPEIPSSCTSPLGRTRYSAMPTAHVRFCSRRQLTARPWTACMTSCTTPSEASSHSVKPGQPPAQAPHGCASDGEAKHWSRPAVRWRSTYQASIPHPPGSFTARPSTAPLPCCSKAM